MIPIHRWRCGSNETISHLISLPIPWVIQITLRIFLPFHMGKAFKYSNEFVFADTKCTQSFDGSFICVACTRYNVRLGFHFQFNLILFVVGEGAQVHPQRETHRYEYVPYQDTLPMNKLLLYLGLYCSRDSEGICAFCHRVIVLLEASMSTFRIHLFDTSDCRSVYVIWYSILIQPIECR